jgi:hypothetical protein
MLIFSYVIKHIITNLDNNIIDNGTTYLVPLESRLTIVLPTCTQVCT